jgi:hypothetical protein
LADNVAATDVIDVGVVAVVVVCDADVAGGVVVGVVVGVLCGGLPKIKTRTTARIVIATVAATQRTSPLGFAWAIASCSCPRYKPCFYCLNKLITL